MVIDPEWLFKQECTFIAGAGDLASIPALGLPEIAIVGRSNVGKSTLINALTNRNSLARTSSSPGHTRQVNFFNLRDLITLVDLPGYGYARASKTQIRGWTNLIYTYLSGRAQLLRVYLLLDSRHLLKDTDIKIMKMLDDKAVTYQIVLTKTDKATKTEITNLRAQIDASFKSHPALFAEIIETSSANKTGIGLLRESIVSLISSE